MFKIRGIWVAHNGDIWSFGNLGKGFYWTHFEVDNPIKLLSLVRILDYDIASQSLSPHLTHPFPPPPVQHSPLPANPNPIVHSNKTKSALQKSQNIPKSVPIPASLSTPA